MLMSLLKDEFGSRFRQSRRNLVLYAFILLLALTAYVCLVTAAILFISETSGILMATLSIALVSTSLAVLLFAVIYVLNWRDRKKRVDLKSLAGVTTASTAATLALKPGKQKYAILMGLVGLALIFANRQSSSDHST